jgi:hypothetical protein
MAARSNRRVTIWSHAGASRTISYIRLVLRDLRENFVAIWHVYRLAGGDVNHPEFRDRIRRLGQEARAVLGEFDRLGVIPYQSPLRGIALYPFLVHEGRGGTHEAFFVFKDTRDEIDSYILQDDLGENGDLYADEKPIPAGWKVSGAIPRLEQEAGR